MHDVTKCPRTHLNRKDEYLHLLSFIQQRTGAATLIKVPSLEKKSQGEVFSQDIGVT